MTEGSDEQKARYLPEILRGRGVVPGLGRALAPTSRPSARARCATATTTS